MAPVNVRTLVEHEYPRWNRLVADAPSGSAYALTDYLAVLSQLRGERFDVIGAFDGDELVGGMPVYFGRCKIGTVATHRSLLAYHGPVIREYASRSPHRRRARQLDCLSALADFLRKVDCVHMVLRCSPALTDIRPFQAAGWSIRPEYSFQVDLTDMAKAWTRLDHNLARLIRRAENAGLSVTDDDDFESLFRQHADIHARKRNAPIYLPEEKFKDYFRRLKALGLCRLYHARLSDGRSVASQLVLTGPHPVSHTVCAASDAHYLSLGGNPYLRWKVFESLAYLGYQANDLTGAPYPHDVSRFKSQLGGELVINWLVERPKTIRYRGYLSLIT